MDEAAEAEAPPNADEAEISGWHMDEAAWYDTVVTHWTKAVSAEDNDGVLGGWGCVDEEDARGSLAFLAQTLGVPAAQWPIAGYRALDCGAGIGRVTGAVLLKSSERVHLVEVSEALLAQAAVKLSEHAARIECSQTSLRDFAPPAGSYNLVWCQWVLGHLTDRDVVALLHRCRSALRPGGALFVKDNAAPSKQCPYDGKYMLDEENAGVIRTHNHLWALARAAGFKLSKTALQTNFPEGLYPVRMYCFVPKEESACCV